MKDNALPDSSKGAGAPARHPEAGVLAFHELQSEREGLRRMLFWAWTLSLAVFLALMVFFVLYLDASKRHLESSLADGLPGLGREVAGIVRSELDEGMKLQEEIAALESRNVALREDMARTDKEIQILKRKEKEYLRLLDQSRSELNEKQRMYEELVVRLEGSGLGAAAASAEGGGEDLGNPENAVEDPAEESLNSLESVAPSDEKRAVLRELNEFLERSGQSGIRVAGCERIESSGLLGPTVSVRGFNGAESAILLPERLGIRRNENQIRLWNEGVGTFTPLGKEPEPLEEGAFDLTFTADSLDEIRHSKLRSLLGLDTLLSGESGSLSGPGGGELPENQDVLLRLNRLLELERGRQFRFTAVESVEGSRLCNVRFESYDTKGMLKNSVEAQKCWFRLFSRDRYIEIQFEDGFIMQDDKRIPFWQNQYRLPLPNVDVGAWNRAGFEFLEEA